MSDTPVPCSISLPIPYLDPPAEAPRKVAMMPHRLVGLVPHWWEATASALGGGVAFFATASDALSVNEKVGLICAAIVGVITGLGPPLKRGYESLKGTTREQRLKDRDAERQADAADRKEAFDQFAAQLATITNQMGTQFGDQIAALASQLGGQIAALNEKLGQANAEAAAARAEAAASRAATVTASAEATEARRRLDEALVLINKTVSHTDKNVSQLKDGNPQNLKDVAMLAAEKSLQNEKDIKAMQTRLSGDEIPTEETP